jgi:hypothetical protein
MHVRLLAISLLIAITNNIEAQEPKLVASFAMKEDRASIGTKINSTSVLSFNSQIDAEEPTEPLLVFLNGKLGIYDYIARRILYLGADYAISEIKDYSSLALEQMSDGYWLRHYSSAVYLYRNEGLKERVRIIFRGDKSDPFETVWYESRVLFFCDDSGVLKCLDNPVDNGSTSTVNEKDIKNATYVKKLILESTGKRFPTLTWSDSYGLLRNGFPFATTYSPEWEKYFSDRRKDSGKKADSTHSIPSFNGKRFTILLGLSKDGYSYWANGDPIMVVDSNGFLVKTITWQLETSKTIILPTGDIVFQMSNANYETHDGEFKIYILTRTW